MDLSSVSDEQLQRELDRRKALKKKPVSSSSDDGMQMPLIDTNEDTISDKEEQERLRKETALMKQSIAISKIVNKLIDSDPVGEMRDKTRAFEEECRKCIDRLSPKKETIFSMLFGD